jgi:hypothetical protein
VEYEQQSVQARSAYSALDEILKWEHLS